MKRLYGVPGTNASLSTYFPKNQYGAFLIRYTGTAAVGVTVTRANLGTVQFTWNGKDIINVDAEILNLADNLYGGVSEFTSAVGGAFACSVIIPCGQWIDAANVYDVGINDKVALNLSFPDLASAAVVVSATVEVYYKTKTGVMNYLNNIIKRNVVMTGAGNFSDNYPISNVAQLFIKNPAALLSNIQVSKDNNTIVDCSPAVALSYNDYLHLVETTGTTLAIEFGESKDIRENVGGQVNYSYTFSGAGTLQQYLCYLTFTSQSKVLSSRAQAAQDLTSKISAANS